MKYILALLVFSFLVGAVDARPRVKVKVRPAAVVVVR